MAIIVLLTNIDGSAFQLAVGLLNNAYKHNSALQQYTYMYMYYHVAGKLWWILDMAK